MEQWQQWFKGFMKNWFDTLAESLGELDTSGREQFEAAFDGFKGTEIEGFADAWKDLNEPEIVKEQMSESLDAIKEPTEEQMTFLKDWLSILMETIQKQDHDVREVLLSACGKACAGQATDTFKKLWSESDDLKDFLQNMNTKMCEGDNVYRYVDEDTIEIAYPRCLCPIVGFNLISSPVLCNCSRAWLKSNMEATFGKTVQVEQIHTVFNGEKSCSFKIMLN